MPHLLLIEDNPHIRRIYSAKFQAEGFKVTTAENGEQGLVWADVCQPDAILLDIMMPKMDGFEVLKRLRAEPKFKQIPVFILSHKAWPDDVAYALSLGARQFYAKGSSSLQDIVAQICGECGLKKVMILGSNVEAVKPVVQLLQHPKLLCATTTVTAEAVTAVERSAPNLVILLAGSSAVTAFTILSQLKATPATQQVPVIAIGDDPQRLLRADSCLKPDEIHDKLRPTVLKSLELDDTMITAVCAGSAVATA